MVSKGKKTYKVTLSHYFSPVNCLFYYLFVKVTFQKQQERDEALEILKGLCSMVKKPASRPGSNNNTPRGEVSALDLGAGEVSNTTLIAALRDRV